MAARCRVTAVALALAGCLDAPPSGTGGTADDSGPLECNPGDEMTPVSAYNASPAEPGNACDVDGALEPGGTEAGLDRFPGTGCAPLDPTTTDYGGCGCVGVDFGEVLPLDTFTVRARWSPNACGAECVSCDEGRTMDIWAGEDPDSYRFIEHVVLDGDALTDYPLESGGPMRMVVVCRDWYGEDAPDVLVDWITGTCGG